VVERILNTYQSVSSLNAEQAAVSRQKISRYIEASRLLAGAMLGS
jgi:hypothetical protein